MRLPLVVGLAVLIGSWSSAMAAYPIYQNRDEPGRNPYQVEVLGGAQCNFPAVSVGQVLVIEYLSVRFSTNDANSIAGQLVIWPSGHLLSLLELIYFLQFLNHCITSI
jgi:hypothetical protein